MQHASLLFIVVISIRQTSEKQPTYTVNREILVMVLFWPILAPKYEVRKLNTPKYVTLQQLTAKIEHRLNIFLYLYSLICTGTCGQDPIMYVAPFFFFF
jgi:hypothetical protein